MKVIERDETLIVYTEDDVPVADHNYHREIERLQQRGVFKPGEVILIDVEHDEWCGVYSDKRCDCDPDIRDQITGQLLNRESNV